MGGRKVIPGNEAHISGSKVFRILSGCKAKHGVLNVISQTCSRSSADRKAGKSDLGSSRKRTGRVVEVITLSDSSSSEEDIQVISERIKRLFFISNECISVVASDSRVIPPLVGRVPPPYGPPHLRGGDRRGGLN